MLQVRPWHPIPRPPLPLRPSPLLRLVQLQIHTPCLHHHQQPLLLLLLPTPLSLLPPMLMLLRLRLLPLLLLISTVKIKTKQRQQQQQQQLRRMESMQMLHLPLHLLQPLHLSHRPGLNRRCHYKQRLLLRRGSHTGLQPSLGFGVWGYKQRLLLRRGSHTGLQPSTPNRSRSAGPWAPTYDKIFYRSKT